MPGTVNMAAHHLSYELLMNMLVLWNSKDEILFLMGYELIIFMHCHFQKVIVFVYAVPSMGID